MTTDAAPGQPGTAPSPFDPNPPDTNDPFASTGPWAGPPETWQDLASTDAGRQKALDLGRRHGELVSRLRALADANGGGLAGLAKGTMLRLEAANLLTANDRDRLTALIAYMLASAGPGTSQDAAMSELRQLHDAIVNDPASTPLALGMASVALDSATSAALATPTSDHLSFQAGFATGVADTLGVGLGGFGGYAGSVALAVTASGIAQYTAKIISS
jgi:hypothetical protein